MFHLRGSPSSFVAAGNSKAMKGLIVPRRFNTIISGQLNVKNGLKGIFVKICGCFMEYVRNLHGGEQYSLLQQKMTQKYSNLLVDGWSCKKVEHSNERQCDA